MFIPPEHFESLCITASIVFNIKRIVIGISQQAFVLFIENFCSQCLPACNALEVENIMCSLGKIQVLFTEQVIHFRFLKELTISKRKLAFIIQLIRQRYTW